jgi:hypothetical protein
MNLPKHHVTSTGRRFHNFYLIQPMWNLSQNSESLKNHHNYTHTHTHSHTHTISTLESLGMTILLAFHDHYYQWTNFKNNQDTTSRITLMKWPRLEFLYVPDVRQKLQVQWPRPEDARVTGKWRSLRTWKYRRKCQSRMRTSGPESANQV